MLKKQSWLLIPAPPTPNGKLHLGHIGGPLVYPFMPDLGEKLWATLGYQGAPIIYNFLKQPSQRLRRNLDINVAPLTPQQLPSTGGTAS